MIQSASDAIKTLQEIDRDLSGLAQILYVMSCGPEGFDTHDAARLLQHQVEAAGDKIKEAVSELLEGAEGRK